MNSIIYIGLWLVWIILQIQNISNNGQYLSERINNDNPSGNCDCEYIDYNNPDWLTDLDACPDGWQPILSEIRTVDTKQQPSEVGDMVTYIQKSKRWIWYGCRNDKNPEWCHDYEVRYLCQL